LSNNELIGSELIGTDRRRRGSVGRGAGLVIERLRNLTSTPHAAASRCVLGKDTSRCGSLAWRKTSKQSSFCVGVVWQTQSIVQHLAQMKKNQLIR